jgi:DNA-binding response OmpR family regulator
MLPDVHLLVLTDRSGGGTDLLPSLEYLGHSLASLPLASTALTGLAEADAVVVDATQDLREASAACVSAAVHDLAVPVLVVISEAALAALKPTWGFDDWLLPSASPAELETRLRLVGSRNEKAGRGGGGHAIGDLVVDEESYQVRLRGQPLDLTYKEFELLKTLAAHPNRVFTRELLLQEVWGYDYYGGSRTVDVHVRRLRAKLGPEHEALIATVRGVGYKLVPLADRKRDVEE